MYKVGDEVVWLANIDIQLYTGKVTSIGSDNKLITLWHNGSRTVNELPEPRICLKRLVVDPVALPTGSRVVGIIPDSALTGGTRPMPGGESNLVYGTVILNKYEFVKIRWSDSRAVSDRWYYIDDESICAYCTDI
jgi:hypothetical protein